MMSLTAVEESLGVLMGSSSPVEARAGRNWEGFNGYFIDLHRTSLLGAERESNFTVIL